MTENYFNSPISLPRQEGAVLIVALILLVVMTMLGISGMEATKLETRMAANVQDYNTAFQNAESGLAWTSEACKQAGVGALSPLDENFVPVPCGTTPLPRNTSQIRGGIEGRQDGSMNQVPYIVSSAGRSSDDSNDPQTITVTLVGGLLFKTAASDRTTFQQSGTKCNFGQAEKTACASSAPDSPGNDSTPPEEDSQILLNCADAIRKNSNISKCADQLVSRACKLNPALDCNDLRNQVLSP